MSRMNLVLRWSVCVVLGCNLAWAQSPDEKKVMEPFSAEVTGSDVYVRSGPSQNYYTITKLATGTAVTVVGEENSWAAIVPPEGCYSLISASYVDVGEQGKGVINGNAVRVRAATDLNRNKYAVQAKLDKGTEVQILGEGEEGFLKIVPPPGAVLWVSAQYLARVAEDGTRVPLAAGGSEAGGNPSGADEGGSAQAKAAGSEAAEKPTGQAAKPAVPAEGSKLTDATRTVPPPAVDSAAAAELAEAMRPAARPSGEVRTTLVVPKKYRSQLRNIDDAMKAELAKPIAQRNLRPIIEQYRAAGAGSQDEVTKLYAQRRVDQLEAAAESAEAVAEIRQLADRVAAESKEALASRASLRRLQPPVEKGFDAKGELWRSMIYTSPVGPQRFRLVDPGSELPRTLCYVEVPADSHINVEEYLGRVVGVRARGKYLQTGDVNPIMIVVADQLVLLDDPGSADFAPADESAPEAVPPAEGGTVVQAGDPRPEAPADQADRAP